MKVLARRLRQHFGMTARHVAVRSDLPWYGRLVLWLLLIGLGFGIGHWRYADVDVVHLSRQVKQLQQENAELQGRLVRSDRQSQVDQAAQGNLAKEMAALQDQDMQLKEEIAFYKSILAEGSPSGIVKLHSIKLTKGEKPGEYQYRILLVQSGRHDKMVQGSLRLLMNGGQALETGSGIKINFKYYQRVEGSFTMPAAGQGQGLQVQFFEAGGKQPKLTQNVTLPG